MVPNSIPMLQDSLTQPDFFVRAHAHQKEVSVLPAQLQLNSHVCLQFPDEDIRVILINTYSDVARVVICEVGVYGCIMLTVVSGCVHLTVSLWICLDISFCD